jgi:hypothetical protein
MKSRLLAAAIVLLSLIVPLKALAQTNTGQGLEISPPLINLKADPGQVLHAKMGVRNVTTQTVAVKAQYDDFVAGGEEGQPKLLLDGSEKSPYSIKDWLSTPANEVLIPQQQKIIDITVTVPKDASPGGHYGVVRFTALPPDATDTSVSLSASIGSLILVNVSGAVTEKASIVELSASQHGKKRSLFEYGPITISTRVSNGGNIHLQPTGRIRVTNMFGSQAGSFEVNPNKGNVLPQSIRRFDQVLNRKLLFGRYKIQADLVYGTDKKIISSSATFWVIPYKLIVLVVTGLALLVFLIRRYNKLILKRAQKSKKRGKKHDKASGTKT